MDLSLQSHDEDHTFPDIYEGNANLPSVGNTTQEHCRGQICAGCLSLCKSVAYVCQRLCTIQFFSRDDLCQISTFMLIWHYLVNSDDVLSSIMSIVVDVEEGKQQCFRLEQADETTSTSVVKNYGGMFLFGNETQQQEKLQSSYRDYTYIEHLKIVTLCIALVAVVTLALRRHPHHNGRFNVLGTLCSVILLCIEMSIPLVMLLGLGIMLYLAHHFFWTIFISILIFSSLGLLMGRGVFCRSDA